jgi:hypothetical protein
MLNCNIFFLDKNEMFIFRQLLSLVIPIFLTELIVVRGVKCTLIHADKLFNSLF